CEQEGYPVLTAATGAEARAALGGHDIALVLLDLRLPDVDGVELMREIRQGERPPDVVITTAHAGRGSAIAGIEAGAAGYIVKPVEIPRLRALVGSLLERRRLRVENAALSQRAEREHHRLKALYEVANRLASVQDCWQILDLIVREATRLLDVEAAAIRLVEGEGLVLRAWTESAAPLLTRRTLKIGESLTGCVVQTGEPVAVCDLALDSRYDPTHKQAALALGFHAFLGVPLRADARILGTLSIYGKVPHSFQPDEIALLSALGDQASLGIDRARLFLQEQERRRHLEAVRAISEEITRELDLPILLGLITQRAVDLLGAGQGMIRLWDETNEVLVPKAWTGGGDHRGELRLRLGEGVAGTAAQRRQGMIVNDFRTSAYATKEVLQQTSHTVVLAEPLLYRGRLVGVVTINREQGMGPFTAEDQILSALFASQAAIAIENARLFDAARHELAERKRAEEALRESETMFRSVAQSATDAIVSADHEGRIFFWNQGAQAIFGYPEAEVLGKSLSILTPERFRELHVHGMRRLQLTGDPHVLGKTVELAGLRQDGSEFPLELSLASWQAGKQTFYTAIIRDITRRKQAEAALAERARQVARLNEVSQALTKTLDPAAVANAIFDAILALFPGSAGQLWRYRAHEDDLVLVGIAGVGRGAALARSRLGMGEGLAGLAARIRQPVDSSDVSGDVRFINRDWAQAEGLVAG
ncbi:MAG: GAF domain-containing protein, partial [candidate division NC10 bacterium]